LTADKNDEIRSCVEVVERPVFPESISDDENHGTAGVEADEKESFVTTKSIKDVRFSSEREREREREKRGWGPWGAM